MSEPRAALRAAIASSRIWWTAFSLASVRLTNEPKLPRSAGIRVFRVQVPFTKP